MPIFPLMLQGATHTSSLDAVIGHAPAFLLANIHFISDVQNQLEALVKASLTNTDHE